MGKKGRRNIKKQKKEKIAPVVGQVSEITKKGGEKR